MAGLVLSVDPDGVLSGALKAKSALDTVVESARKTEAALKKAGDGGDALKRKFDPAYASALKLGNELDDLDRALKTGVVDAKVYATQIGRLGAETGRTAGGLRSFGGGLQNLGYQVNDFAVQVGAGTSATQALGQQLPQVLQAFGLWGVALSVVVAAGIPLIGHLFSFESRIVSLDDAMANLDAATSGLKATQDILMMSVTELAEKYGSYGLTIKRVAQDLAANQLAEMNNALTKTILESASAFDQFAGRAATAFSSGVTFSTAVGNISRELGTTNAEAYNLAQGFDGLRNAMTVEDRIAAFRRVQNALRDAGVDASRLPPELNKAMVEAGVLAIKMAEAKGQAQALSASAPGSGWMGAAIGETNMLIGRLITAQSAVAAIGAAQRQFDRENQTYGGRGGDPRQFMPGAAKAFSPSADVVKAADAMLNPVIGASGGGSGGGRGGVSAAEKAANDYKRLIETLDPATRSANDFADAQKTINDALKIGSISATEAARAMGLAKDKYTEGGEAAKFWKGINSDLKESFLDMAVDGVNSFEDIARSIKRAALEALLFKSGPLAGLFGGGGAKAGGGFLGKIFGGGGGKGLFAGLFDGGGTISNGQFGIVGEKGPEIVRSTNSGAVVTSRANTARQLSGGGGTDVRVHVTTSIDNEGGIRNYVQTMAVQASQSAVNQVKGSLAGWSNQLGSDGVLT